VGPGSSGCPCLRLLSSEVGKLSSKEYGQLMKAVSEITPLSMTKNYPDPVSWNLATHVRTAG